MDLDKLNTLRENYESAEKEYEDAINEHDKEVAKARKEAQKVYDETVDAAKAESAKSVKRAHEKLSAKQKEFIEYREDVKEALQKANINLGQDNLYSRTGDENTLQKALEWTSRNAVKQAFNRSRKCLLDDDYRKVHIDDLPKGPIFISPHGVKYRTTNIGVAQPPYDIKCSVSNTTSDEFIIF